MTELASLRRSISPVPDLVTVVTLRARLLATRPDLVVTHQSKAAALTRFAAVGTSIPVVHSLSMASFGPGYGRLQHHLFRVVECWLGRRTTAFAVVGRDLAERYRSLGIPADRFHVVRSGATLADPTIAHGTRDRTRRSVRAELGIPDAASVVLFVGSLDARKGVLGLPDLLAAVGGRPDLGRVDLVVAGEGTLDEAMNRLAGRLGLAQRVHLLGHVDGIDRLLWAADVMVLPSRAEGLPQVLVQAAAAGLPFAAYRVDGVEELLGMGAHGRAVDPGRPGALAAAVAELAGEPRRGPVVDLGSWRPEAIRAAHRALLMAAATGDRGVVVAMGDPVAAVGTEVAR